MTSLTSSIMTSLIPLLWRHYPRYYDVTNLIYYDVTNPAIMTSLPPLLWRHYPRYYDVTTWSHGYRNVHVTVVTPAALSSEFSSSTFIYQVRHHLFSPIRLCRPHFFFSPFFFFPSFFFPSFLVRSYFRVLCLASYPGTNTLLPRISWP